jgi:hypothetical protein
MARNLNTEENQNIKTDNKSFEGVGQFKYLENTLIKKNLIHEDIKSRLKAGNGCCLSVQNGLFVFQFAIQKYK